MPHVGTVLTLPSACHRCVICRWHDTRTTTAINPAMSLHRHRSVRGLSVLVAAVFACAALPAFAAPPTLEDSLSHSEFVRAGLDRLTPEQLAALNALLVERMRCTAADQRAPREARRRDDDAPIRARLVGDFNGWQDGTVFTLDNGQRWRVMDDEPYRTAKVHAPEVVIERGVFGGWVLSLAGSKDIVRVAPAD